MFNYLMMQENKEIREELDSEKKEEPDTEKKEESDDDDPDDFVRN